MADPTGTTQQAMRDAIALAQSGRMSDAAQTLRAALAADPAHAGANGLMGTLLHAAGRGAEAVTYLQRAHDAAPNEPRLAYQLGAVLVSLGQSSRGIALMQRAIEIDPKWTQAINGLANALYAAGDFEAADAAYRRSLAAAPGQPDALCGLAGLLIVSGRPAQAVALFREAARLHPANAEVLGKLVSALNYADDATASESFDAHRRWGLAIGAGPAPVLTNQPAPERPLRIGFLSPDLYDHSCAYFLRPILAHRDRSSYHATCYSTSGKSDWMTAQLKPLADAWRDAAGFPDAKLIDTIRADGIDVLLELAGHTAMGPLAALRHRAAPVQATYLGYPNTTGLPTMDWRIVDAITDPPGAEAWHTEKLARLDHCFLCYSPPDHAPPIREAAPAAPLTFGSFNSIRKLSPGVVRVWSRVLEQAPESRLLLKARGLSSPFARRNILDQFAARGIAPQRIELADMVPSKPDHLAWYHRLDIALDTFPYNGTTTTCEALWMGVPVVTLAGSIHAGRVGASLLSAAGMPDLIARSEDDYVSIAAGLARNSSSLAEVRATMRRRLAGSPLMDGPRHAASFYSALRTMWRQWCANPGAPS